MSAKASNTLHEGIALCLISAFLSSCATGPDVTASTYLAETVPFQRIPVGTSFYVAANGDVANPIFDKRVKEKIEVLLRGRGYELRSADEARYRITYAYDLEGMTKVRSRPLYSRAFPPYHRFSVWGSHYFDSHFGADLGYVVSVPETYARYLARLRVRVVDTQAEQAQVEAPAEENVIWVGEASVESEDPDLRETINYLLVAAFEYFGVDTHGTEEIRVRWNHPLVEQLELEELPTNPPQ